MSVGELSVSSAMSDNQAARPTLQRRDLSPSPDHVEVVAIIDYFTQVKIDNYQTPAEMLLRFRG